MARGFLSLSLPALGLLLCIGCRERPKPLPALPPPTPAWPPDAAIVVLGSEHDSLDGARKGLAEALRRPVDLPLPFPRVERHGDRFRVVLARGKAGALSPLLAVLAQNAGPPKVILQGQAGGDDVVRLGIVCTEGAKVPLYAAPFPKDGVLKEIGKLAPGEVVVPGEDDGGPDSDSEEAEKGFLHVVAPTAGLVRGPDLLLPADCTPRDEDNDDGNGRLLQSRRLCLTTRFSGRDGDVTKAALVAVSASYRRCQRFPESGTFDGFDQSPGGTQFAVEAKGEKGGAGVAIYDVGAAGQLALRFHLPGLLRPAYLGAGLVAVADDGAGQGLFVLPAAALSGEVRGEPAPKRVFALTGPRFVPEVPTHRPAAPTLQEGRIFVSFQKGCQGADERRVKGAARGDFEQCVMDVEVSVGLDGTDPKQKCQLNNSPSGLEQPIAIRCP